MDDSDDLGLSQPMQALLRTQRAGLPWQTPRPDAPGPDAPGLLQRQVGEGAVERKQARRRQPPPRKTEQTVFEPVGKATPKTRLQEIIEYEDQVGARRTPHPSVSNHFQPF